MKIEEKLTELILSRYNSKREFTIAAGIPYTTLDSVLRRGIGNSSVDTIIKICHALHISADALAVGEIEYRADPKATAESEDVIDIVNETKSRLTHIGTLTVNGKIVDIESVDPLIEALDIGYEMVKRKTEKSAEKTITESITKT